MTEFQGQDLNVSKDQEDESMFAEFYKQLKKEAHECGDDNVDEEEARELFEMMKSEFAETGEGINNDDDEADDDDDVSEVSEEDIEEEIETESDFEDEVLPMSAREKSEEKKKFDNIMKDLKDEWGEEAFDSDDDEIDFGKDAAKVETKAFDTRNVQAMREIDSNDSRAQRVMLQERDEEAAESSTETSQEHMLAERVAESYVEKWYKDKDLDPAYGDAAFQELQDMLPGMPRSRIQKIWMAYQEDISTPSILKLVPILREKMPVSFCYLVFMNILKSVVSLIQLLCHRHNLHDI